MGTELRFTADERRYVFALCRRILRDDDAADEVAQDALLRAFRQRAQFRGDAHPRTWLFRIATTTAFGYLRGQRRYRARVGRADDATMAAVASDRADPETALGQAEVAALVQAGLRGLDRQSAAILIGRAEDRTEPELAAALGMSVAAVKARAHRGRGVLRQRLHALAA